MTVSMGNMLVFINLQIINQEIFGLIYTMDFLLFVV